MNKFIYGYSTTVNKYIDFTGKHMCKTMFICSVIGGTSGLVGALNSNKEHYYFIVPWCLTTGILVGGVSGFVLPVVGPAMILSSLVAYPIYRYKNIDKSRSPPL